MGGTGIRESMRVYLHNPPQECLVQRSSSTECSPLPLSLYPTQQVRYGDMALFFHDRYGGDVIGVAWKPQPFTPRAFSLLNSTNMAPVSVAVTVGEGKKARVSPLSLVPNVQYIIASFATIGGEHLVAGVNVK